MPWNNSTKIMTAPVGIGDISRAVGYTSLDLGTLIKNGPLIRPMAKYKPIRHSKQGVLTDAERKAKRFGMTEPTFFTPGVSGSTITLPPAWEYLRPRGNTCNNGSNEWYRMLDFANGASTTDAGYDGRAVQPFAIKVEDFGVRNELIIIDTWVDSYVNQYYNDQTVGYWTANRSLSLNDLIGSGSGTTDYSGYKLTFLVYDVTPGSEALNVIVTKTTIGQLATTGYTYFELRPKGAGVAAGYAYEGTDGYAYPVIPILNEQSRQNHEFTIAACLCNRGLDPVPTGPDRTGTPAYNVITSNFQSCISLGFDPSRLTDRVENISSQSRTDVDLISGQFTPTPPVQKARSTAASGTVVSIKDRNGNITSTTDVSGWKECTFGNSSSNAVITITADSTWEGNSITLSLQMRGNGPSILVTLDNVLCTENFDCINTATTISSGQTKQVTIDLSHLIAYVYTADTGPDTIIFSLYAYIGEQSGTKKLITDPYNLQLTLS